MNFRQITSAVLIYSSSLLVFANEYMPVESLASLNVSFADTKWNGIEVPDGQQCKMFSGNGTSPSLKISNIPTGTNAILISFNDKTFKMNDNGGHGIVGIWIEEGQSSIIVPSVEGESNDLPKGMFIEEKFRSNRGEDGAYLPPCSGGRGNEYDATIRAVFKAKDVGGYSTLLAEGIISLGKY